VIGFILLLAVALLLLWASVTGGGADVLAALLTPVYLEESS
jgi:hypothetical protein